LSTFTFEKLLKTLTRQVGTALNTSQQSKSWSKLNVLYITAALKLTCHHECWRKTGHKETTTRTSHLRMKDPFV